MQEHPVQLVRVFPDGAGGGNPAPIVLDAAGMRDDAMREVAGKFGHESGFVLPPSPGSAAEFRMRYFVPLHEMEMCGHATVGALWLLRQAGRWTTSSTTIETASGLVRGYVRNAETPEEYVEITQPAGTLQAVDEVNHLAKIADVLQLSQEALLPLPVLNAATSRVKTLIGLRSADALHALQPDFARMQGLCEAIGSTGLYPYAADSQDGRVFHARQFPKSSGYPEDAATGIAAAALLFGLAAQGLVRVDAGVTTIRQGEAMGAPSAIKARFELDSAGKATGCYIGGSVSR